MKKLLALLLSMSLLLCCKAQSFKIGNPQPMPLADFINSGKRTAVPIWIQDKTIGTNINFSGSGVLISDTSNRRWFILTCNHVLKITDTSGKFLKYADYAYATFNLDNDSSMTLPINCVYRDSTADFALLEYFPNNFISHFENLSLPYYLLNKTDNVRDGETIFYSGFPMAIGVGKRNYPVSRDGSVSQVVKEYSYILINGFVQGGYSGGPVFVIHRISNGWVFDLIGIIKAYPIYEEKIISTKDNKEEERVTNGNSGFTIVIKIDQVMDILKTKFAFH